MFFTITNTIATAATDGFITTTLTTPCGVGGCFNVADWGCVVSDSSGQV